MEGREITSFAQGIHGTHGILPAGSPQSSLAAAARLQQGGSPSPGAEATPRNACTNSEAMNSMIRNVPMARMV